MHAIKYATNHTYAITYATEHTCAVKYATKHTYAVKYIRAHLCYKICYRAHLWYEICSVTLNYSLNFFCKSIYSITVSVHKQTFWFDNDSTINNYTLVTEFQILKQWEMKTTYRVESN